jgi:hypothetical protein
MKLSALIREGARRRPQCTFHYFSPSEGSCAIGAAMEALTGTSSVRRGLGALGEQFPALFSLDNKLACPIAWHEVAGQQRHFLALSGLITHLNDDHGLSREQIADWLASLGF